MVVSQKWTLSLLRHYKSWLPDNSQQCRSWLSKIEADLMKPSKSEAGVYLCNLHFVSNYHGAQSVLFSHGQDLDASLIALNVSLEYELVSLKIRSGLKFVRSSSIELAQLCNLFCTSIVLNSSQVRGWIGDLLIESHRTGKPLGELDYDPFTVLSLQLAYELSGQTPSQLPQAQNYPGFYDRLLQAESAAAAQVAIEQLAIDRAQLVLDKHIDYPPFEDPPFDLWPVDLMAIAKLRFPQARFTFGVLDSPLCHPPEEFPFHQDDPLIARVLKRCGELMTLPDVHWR